MGYFDFDRELSIKAEIYRPNDAIVEGVGHPVWTITSADIYSFSASSHLSDKAPFVGSTASTTFKMSVTRSSLTSMLGVASAVTIQDLNLIGYKIVPIIECDDISSPLGVMYVKRISAAEQVEYVTIEAIDAIGWLFNGSFVCDANDVTNAILGKGLTKNTFGAIFARLCDHVGATIGSNSYDNLLPALNNGNETVKFTDVFNMLEGREMSFRELLGYIAAYGGGYARANLMGNIEIVSINTASKYTVTPDAYFTYTARAESTLNIQYMRCRYAFDTSDEAYPRLFAPSSVTDPLTTTNVFECGCPFVRNQTQASRIYWQVANKVYESGSLDFRGNPSLLVGDAVTVQDLDGTRHKLLASSVNVSFNNGGLRMTVNSDMPEKTIAEYADSVFDKEGFIKPSRIRGIKTPAVQIGRGGITVKSSSGAVVMDAGLVSATGATSTPDPMNQANFSRVTADTITAGTVTANNIRPYIASATFSYPETSWEQFLTKIVPSAEWGSLTYNVTANCSAAMANTLFRINNAHVHLLTIQSNTTNTGRLCPPMAFINFNGNCRMVDLYWNDTNTGSGTDATPLTFYYGGGFFSLRNCAFVRGYYGINAVCCNVSISADPAVVTRKGRMRSYFIRAISAFVNYTGAIPASTSGNQTTGQGAFVNSSSLTVLDAGDSGSSGTPTAPATIADVPITIRTYTDNGFEDGVLRSGYTSDGRDIGRIDFTLPTNARTITNALLTMRRVAGFGENGAINTRVGWGKGEWTDSVTTGSSQTFNTAVLPAQTVTIDVTAIMTAAKSSSATALALTTIDSAADVGDNGYSPNWAVWDNVSLQITYTA